VSSASGGRPPLTPAVPRRGAGRPTVLVATGADATVDEGGTGTPAAHRTVGPDLATGARAPGAPSSGAGKDLALPTLRVVLGGTERFRVYRRRASLARESLLEGWAASPSSRAASRGPRRQGSRRLTPLGQLRGHRRRCSAAAGRPGCAPDAILDRPGGVAPPSTRPLFPRRGCRMSHERRRGRQPGTMSQASRTAEGHRLGRVSPSRGRCQDDGVGQRHTAHARGSRSGRPTG
jgi:hypothetical protein